MRLAIGVLAASFCLAQADPEEEHLRQVVAEAGNSNVELVRALEKHLAKYPKTERRAELERALVKTAVELRDSARILKYGERVLEREADDIEILERVTRALLGSDDRSPSERALKYAKRFEEIIRTLEKEKPPSGRSRARMREELGLGLSRALVFQSRATGNLGRLEEAVALARRSWDSYPSAENAREIARWLARLDKNEEAARALADAFSIADPRGNDADRAADRVRMGELYRKAKGSDAGLGDLVLEAYDRNTALLARRKEAARTDDPNAGISDPLQFTLSGIKGDKLDLRSLKGKVIVLDFWATWCGPCRVQYPLYEQVKQKYKARGDVIFLGINTDEDRSLVPPFLEQNKWAKAVYFEDGLSSLLRVSSIPTTVIFNKRGEMFSRMNGFLPERFVDMLIDRIQQALAE